jgi:ADP-ribose pyrophosphatase
MTNDVPEIQTLHSRVVYQNRWMTVREDAIRRRNGSETIYGVVEKSNFVLVVPMEDDGSVWLVEQYRYPVSGRYWEFPQGSWEGMRDHDPLAVARGELREETGLDAGEMTLVGHLFQACGFSTQGYHVYLARDLRQGVATPEEEEEGLIARRFSAATFVEMLRTGVIKDGTTLAAYGLLRVKGLIDG